MKEKKTIGLCHRCEHRAVFIEDGHGPRSECKDVGRAVYSCYMYTPVRPVVLTRNQGDRRQIGDIPLISARAHAVRVASELDMTMTSVRGGTLLIWTLSKASER